MKILEVADRLGWAIDRLSKPLSEMYDNVDMSYFNIKPERYLDSGYSKRNQGVQFTQELGEQYDVIHFHRIKACLFNFDAMKAKKVITVHTERHEDWEDPKLKMFDLVIAPTKHAMNHLIETFPEMKDKVEHIPHGIDLTKYKVLDDIVTIPKRIGYVGRVVEWKHFSDIVDFSVNLGYKVAGCGYIEKSEFYNPHNYREGTDFDYISFLPEPKMAEFYNSMNLFICYSDPHIEAGPLPILEAMACGVPVISTDIGWVTDNCTHGENVHIVKQDKNELTKAIKLLMEDKEYANKLRTNALELIKDFSLEKYGERVNNVINKLCQK